VEKDFMLKTSAIVCVFFVFLSSRASAQSFVQMVGKDASLEYDGKVLTFQNGKEKRVWKWAASPQVADRINIDAMFASAYIRSGGKIEFPDDPNMTSEQLEDAMKKAKSQVFASIKEPSTAQLVMQLELMLELERNQSRMCQLYANQKPLSEEQQKLYQDMMKLQMPQFGNPGSGATGPSAR
jgi:hypothetical protein